MKNHNNRSRLQTQRVNIERNIVIDLAIASRIGAAGAKDAALILLNRCQCAEIANAAAENIPKVAYIWDPRPKSVS